MASTVTLSDSVDDPSTTKPEDFVTNADVGDTIKWVGAKNQ